MAKNLIGIVVVSLVLAAAVAAFGYFRPAQDLSTFPQCLHCGMNRTECSHTRMTVQYKDGSQRAECSLHCLLADLLEQPGRQPVRVLAADYNDRKLVDAAKSWWVRYDNHVECDGSTVMLAFRSEVGADSFISSFGGKKLSFEQALEDAYGARKARLETTGAAYTTP